MNLAQYIDHTLLKPTATDADIKKLCAEAKQHKFYAVCVNGTHVASAKKEIAGSEVKLAAVIGFPLGAMATRSKLEEAINCVADGADEIDMVINLGWLREGQDDAVYQEIRMIKAAIKDKILKVIIETCYLNEDEIRRACKAVIKANADFVKTSTGFGPGGARPEDINLIKESIDGQAAIKASGGIKDKTTALGYIEMGVLRIGTSSGISIIS